MLTPHESASAHPDAERENISGCSLCWPVCLRSGAPWVFVYGLRATAEHGIVGSRVPGELARTSSCVRRIRRPLHDTQAAHISGKVAIAGSKRSSVNSAGAKRIVTRTGGRSTSGKEAALQSSSA